MAQPITWRNVDAPDLRGAGALMGLAGNSLNTGFDKLGEVLKQRQDIASQNWDQQKVNNTQAFMDTLSKYRTPEEYQAALASGELDRMRQEAGAQIDAAATRTAEEARLPFLQQRVTVQNAFTDSQRVAKEAPLIAGFKAQAMQDPIAARAALAEMPLSDQGRAEAEAYLRSLTRENTQDDRATTKFNNEQAMFPLELDAKRVSIAAQRDGMANNALSRQLTQLKIQQAREEILNGGTPEQLREQSGRSAKREAEARQEIKNNTYWGAGLASSPEGAKRRAEVLKGLPEDQRGSVENTLSDYVANGIPIKDAKGKVVERIPMSADLYAWAVEGSNDTKGFDGFGLMTVRGRNAKELIDEAITNPETRNKEFMKNYLTGYAYHTRSEQGLDALLAKVDAPDDVSEVPKPVSTPPISRPELPKPTPRTVGDTAKIQEAVEQAGFRSLYGNNPSAQRGSLRQY